MNVMNIDPGVHNPQRNLFCIDPGAQTVQNKSPGGVLSPQTTFMTFMDVQRVDPDGLERGPDRVQGDKTRFMSSKRAVFHELLNIMKIEDRNTARFFALTLDKAKGFMNI